jgi:hypothetical protein
MHEQKRFTWNNEKNEQLKHDDNRNNIDFEIITDAISKGKILDIAEHPNAEKYPNQKIFVVEINNYAYCVPFIENENEIFLKTIFPDRKMTKKYLNNEK